MALEAGAGFAVAGRGIVGRRHNRARTASADSGPEGGAGRETEGTGEIGVNSAAPFPPPPTSVHAERSGGIAAASMTAITWRRFIRRWARDRGARVTRPPPSVMRAPP